MNRQAEHDIRHKTRVLDHAEQSGNVSYTCRYFGISRDTFYRWKQQFNTGCAESLINSKPCTENQKNGDPKDVEEKKLYVRIEF